jgi:hypothetical protein
VHKAGECLIYPPARGTGTSRPLSTKRIAEHHSLRFRFEPFNFANHQNWLPPSANVLAQATRCYQDCSRTLMTTCRRSKTGRSKPKIECRSIAVRAHARLQTVGRVQRVLVLPSAPFEERSSLLIYSNPRASRTARLIRRFCWKQGSIIRAYRRGKWQRGPLVCRRPHRRIWPVLLRVDRDAGHGIGSDHQQAAELMADEFTFFGWQLEMTGFPPR